ncbi:PstS family phosphate ABC transporter substrate-binding protein [Vibrio gallaecicus]|uniref:Phosphate-binding protein n=1 Tax=Vibrio gallaecicus TaxID=552386 RepID=A0ABV4NC13_9VIBR
MLNTLFNLITRLFFSVALLSAHTTWAKDLIQIEGSSTVYPITRQLSQQFMLAEGTKTQVVIGITGTGGGFRKFCRGRTDISNASRPIKETEKALCKANGIEFLELPVALDALTVVVNKQNNWVDSLSLEQLNRIWRAPSENVLSTWEKVNDHYPNQPLNLHGPGSDSGTYDYFVDVVLDKEISRQDYIANEDDNAMTAEVAVDRYAMAFLGFAYYSSNQDKLKAIAIIDENGVATLPSVENVTNGLYGDLSRPLFVYVNKSALDKRASLKRLLELYFHQDNIHRTVTKSGYIPLSAEMYDQARSILQKGKTGSVFNNEDLSSNFEQFLHGE